MKKWLLLAAVAAAAAWAAKKLLSVQTDNAADAVSDVIYDDASKTPVQADAPKPDAAPSPKAAEDMPEGTSSETQNS